MATRFFTRTDAAKTVGRGFADKLAALGTCFAEFVRHPLDVGSPIPTFRHTVNRLLDPIDWRTIRTFVEFGPGTGIFTAGVLERMRPDARLIAIDCSSGFTDHLREAIPDRRLLALTGSAGYVRSLLAARGIAQIDCILSGLPFSTLPEGMGAHIIEESRRLLRPGGLFVAYQVRAYIRPLLERRFTMIGEAYEWLNLPPYHLYWFKKPDPQGAISPPPP